MSFSTVVQQTCNKLLSGNHESDFFVFHQNDLMPDVFGLLIDALCQTKTITQVNADFCDVTDDHCKLFASLIVGNNTINSLSLTYNEIGDDGAEMLSKALCLNPNFELIDLGFNEITNVGAMYFTRQPLDCEVVLFGNPMDYSNMPKINGKSIIENIEMVFGEITMVGSIGSCGCDEDTEDEMVE